jgi:hypothetical protein
MSTPKRCPPPVSFEYERVHELLHPQARAQEHAKKVSASGLLRIRKSPRAPSSAGAGPAHSSPLDLTPVLGREGRLAALVDTTAGAASPWSSARRRLRRRGAPRGGAEDGRSRERPPRDLLTLPVHHRRGRRRGGSRPARCRSPKGRESGGRASPRRHHGATIGSSSPSPPLLPPPTESLRCVATVDPEAVAARSTGAPVPCVDYREKKLKDQMATREGGVNRSR